MTTEKQKIEELKEIPLGHTKDCTSCRHVRTCFLFRMAIQGIASFDKQAEDIMKFPMKPQEIGFKCPEYESPLDVIVKPKDIGV